MRNLSIEILIAFFSDNLKNIFFFNLSVNSLQNLLENFNINRSMVFFQKIYFKVFSHIDETCETMCFLSTKNRKYVILIPKNWYLPNTYLFNAHFAANIAWFANNIVWSDANIVWFANLICLQFCRIRR